MSFWANYRRPQSPGRRNLPPPPQAVAHAARGGRYEFSGERKEYFEFMQVLDRRLAKDKIAYLCDEAKIRDIDNDPEPPVYEELPNVQRIPESVKAKVAQTNADISKRYHAAMALKVKKREEMKLHIPSMIAIIENLTPSVIREKINIIRLEA
jgi:hypothetical protein